MSGVERPKRCGTVAGAAAHYRRGEKPCDDCRAARNAYAHRYGRNRGEQPKFGYDFVRRYVTGVEDVDFKAEFFRSES